MLHCDEETLSLLALGPTGRDGFAEDEAHIAGCDRCRAELATLRRVVIAARSGRPQDDASQPDEHQWDMLDDVLDGLNLDDPDQLRTLPRIEPPARVWSQIAAATGVRATPNRPAPAAPPAGGPGVQPGEPPVPPIVESRVDPAVGPAPRPVRRAPGPSGPSGLSGDGGPPVPRQRFRRARLDARLLAVAAGCLVIGLLAGVICTRLVSDSGDSAGTSVAATRLNGLPAAPAASGRADVIQSGQGRTLTLDVRRLRTPNGFYEVWLIDRTVTKMVPVGVLSGSEGRFTLPADVNLADYPVVDVSIEPMDGNPGHSGKSVLRGTLRS